METDWSVEAGEDAVVITVPWVDPSGRLLYIDLEQGGSIEAIAEVQDWPELLTMLLALNAKLSDVWTTKCDAWVLTGDELKLDFGPAAYGFGAYCDVLPKSLNLFSSASSMQLLVQQWADRAGRTGSAQARADFVLRPALWHGTQGFGITLYFFGYGDTEALARKDWAEAIQAVGSVVTATGDTMGSAGE